MSRPYFTPFCIKKINVLRFFFLHFYYNLKCLLLLSTFLWKLVSAMGYIVFKVIVTFYITIQSFFLRIARYELWILRKKSELLDANLQLWEKSQNCEKSQLTYLFFSPLQKQKMVRTRTAIYRISRKKIWILSLLTFYISQFWVCLVSFTELREKHQN